MATEISREFKPGEGIVAVVIRDEFGSDHHQSVRVLIVDKCPACGHQNVLKSPTAVDVDATVAAHIADIDKITALKVDGFAAAGMDVAVQKAGLLANTASKG